MKFYEICLGKLTAGADNLDTKLTNSLTLQAYIGICDSANQLSLIDHLIHFATQGLEEHSQEIEKQGNIVPQLLHKRAKAFMSQQNYERAQVDFEKASGLLELKQSRNLSDEQDVKLYE